MDEIANLFESRPRAAGGRRRWMLGAGIVTALCLAYFAGSSMRSPAKLESGMGQVLYYVDPMHPAYRSQKPGMAPDCGMDLQPVYAGGESAPAAAPGHGSVRLTADQEQMVRLETEVVQAAARDLRVHTSGRVAADEALTYSVSAGVAGWVRRVLSDRTGSQVKRGEALAVFYSKDISAPQQAYIYALESCQRLKLPPSPPAAQLALATQQLATARDYLRFLGMGDAQIEELGRTGLEASDVNLVAPATGRILERHVAVGQRFMTGELLYRIANLERIWVLADVHPGEAAWLSSITGARIILEGLPPMQAAVAQALPQFDEQGRIGKLRLEVNNPRGTLVPGMIVNVELDAPARSAVTAPADAVIYSGKSMHVFIALGGGRYELRSVETGWQEGDRVEIRSGVKPGERVVTTGAFLLDSESRMKNPTDDTADAECGMKVHRSNARRLDWKGTDYYFCSESCERKFLARRRQ